MPEPALPFKIAVLCYLYDPDGNVLLLHRVRPPNADMYSPIGGKLEIHEGECPHDCARREIREEAGLDVAPDALRMIGMVTETAYEGEAHWLLFLFEVTRPVGHDEIDAMHIDEGRLEWVPVETVPDHPIPESDRRIMWPLVQEHRSGFFAVHIDCRHGDLRWTLNETRG